MASGGPGLQLRLRQLKKDVLHVLSSRPDGIEKCRIWATVTSELGRKVSAVDYGVHKLTDVLYEWQDEIEEYKKDDKIFFRIRHDTNKPPSLNDKNDFPSLDEMLGGAKAPGLETKSNKKPSKTDKAQPKEKDTLTVEVVMDTGSDTVSQKATGNNSAAQAQEDSILELEVKRTVIEVFSKLGPKNSITLLVMWKLVCDELGDISRDKFKKFLERFIDIVEIDIPAGPTKEEETYKLSYHVVTRLSNGESINAVLNKPSRSDKGEVIDNTDNQNFEKEFGVFLRNLLKFYPNGCSVHVIMQNQELQKNFPMMLRMTPFEIHRLLSNTEGVWFDGTLCFLALSSDLMKKIQIIALRLISNGNFGEVMVPYLAEMIRRSDISLIAINDRQVAQVLEATCVPNILFRNGEVYYRVQSANLDQIILGLVRGDPAATGRESNHKDDPSDEDDSDISSEEDEEDKQEKQENKQPTGMYTSKKSFLETKDIVPLRKGVYEILKDVNLGLKFTELRRKLLDVLNLKINISKKRVNRYCYDITERNGKRFRLKKHISLDEVTTIPTERFLVTEKTQANEEDENSDEEQDNPDTVKNNSQHSKREFSEEDIATLRNAVIEMLSQYQKNFGTGLRLAPLKKLLRPHNIVFNKKQLHKYCLGNILQKDGKSYWLKPEVAQKRPTAMQLMSSLTTWGQPAGPSSSTKSGDSVIDLTSDTPDRGTKPKQVLKQDFISFDLDPVPTIDLTEESPARSSQPSQSYHGIGNMPARFQGPGPQLPLGAQGQGQFPQGSIPSLFSLQRPTFNQGPVPPQRQGFSIPMTAMDCTPTRNNLQVVSNNPFMERDSSGMGPGFRDVIVDLTVQPIVKKEFEQKEILAQPVYVPRGQRPSPDMVESIARECIDTLADANEYVSPERIEKLLLQRFGVHHVKQLGFPYPDKISCINEASRMINKINGYIYAFVKTRCICTLFELRECLREFVPNKEDFSKLKLGPLQRFPVVFEQFRFPPDQETIPEITSTDILEHFRNYLSKKNKWTSRLELEDFMNYLVETFSADNAYYLGVRIRSLPLAAQVGLPLAAQVGLPLAAQVGLPLAAQVGLPLAAQVGLPLAAQVGLPLAAQVGLPLAAQVGLPLAAQVGLPLAAQVGLPLAAQVGLPLAAQVGLLLDHLSDG